MYRLTLSALGLTLGLTVAILATKPASLAAQTGLNSPPVPGPYQVMRRAQPMPTPAPNTNPAYAVPMPYWMQNQQRPTTQAPAAPPQQQPFIQGWRWSPLAPDGQARNAPALGYFPGYNQAPPQQNYPYGSWGPQGQMPGFMPMNNNAYGYQPQR